MDKRQDKRDNRKLQESCHVVTNMTPKSNAVCESEEETIICCSDSDDGDFVLNEQSKKRKLDVMSPISLCCDRLGLSARKRAMFAASCMKQMGVSVQDTNVSVVTAWRKGCEERQKKSQAVRELFQAHPACTLHWDGKKIKVKQGVISDRCVVYISSADEALPNLKSFVALESWLIFDLLELQEPQTWLQQPCSTWSHNNNHMCFKKFVQSLTVVNDVAERGVKMVSDFIDMSQDESQRHYLTQVIEWHRQEFPSFTKDVLDKI